MKPPTTDDLRNLTGAPATLQPLITEQEFSVEEAKSPRPIWTKPVPKLAVAGILLTPVFILAASFLVGGGQSESSQPVDTAQAKPKPEPTIDPAAQMQRENARLKSTAALEGQQNLETQLAKQSNAKPLKAAQKPSLSKSSSVKPKAITETVAIPATPPPLATAPVPRPAAIGDRRFESSSSNYAPSRAPTEAVDPEQRWRQLARLGSYGSVQPESSTVPEWSSVRNSKPVPLSAEVLELSAEAIPTARITSTSAVQTNSSAILASQANQDVIVPTVKMSSDRQPPAIAPPKTIQRPILQEAEARILNGSPSSQPTALIAGASASGVLATPLVWDDAKQSDRFTVVLSQPIRDARGRTALPANTQLLVQVEEISPTGRVQLSAKIATWQQAGLTKEITLPLGVIQIRGESGKPLIAQQFSDKGKEIAAMDRGQFLLGAVRGASEQFTQSSTNVQTGNGNTVVSQQNQRPNLIAGALKGGSDAILETISQRNQRAVEEIQQRPPIRYIEAGRRVQIFVNQSIQLPG